MQRMHYPRHALAPGIGKMPYATIRYRPAPRMSHVTAAGTRRVGEKKERGHELASWTSQSVPKVCCVHACVCTPFLFVVLCAMQRPSNLPASFMCRVLHDIPLDMPLPMPYLEALKCTTKCCYTYQDFEFGYLYGFGGMLRAFSNLEPLSLTS